MSNTIRKLTALNLAVRGMRPAMFTAMVFSLFINVLALVSPLYMLQVYDRVLSSRNEMTLLMLSLVTAFLFIVYGALEALRTRVLVRGGASFENLIRVPLFAAVLQGTVTKTAPVGDAQPFRDADNVREFLTGSGLIAFCDVPWVPVFVAACFVLHPMIGFLSIGAGLVTLVIALTNEYATKTALNRATQASMAAHADVTATLRNAEVMSAMGMAGALRTRWEGSRNDQMWWQASASDRGGLIMALLKSFRQIVQMAILGGGAYLVIKGEMSAGSIIAGSVLMGRALAPIEMVVGSWKGFTQMRGSWARLQALFQAVGDAPERMALPAPEGHISFENAVCGAPGGKQAILKGVSFQLPAGEVLGIIGPSAAGKSTLVRAMVGVWRLASGTVRIDGFDVTQWDAEALGPYIGYLPQDVELFAGTIAQNIARFRSGANDADVIEAAKLAGVHELIQALPGGYDTQIGSGGQALSGGQRQRIGLARAIFGTPKLVVLDEPNASLDSVGEAALIQTVAELKKRHTSVVFITHKTNMLGLADKILLLNQGTVQLFGDRDETLAKIFGGPKAVVPSAGAPTQGVVASGR